MKTSAGTLCFRARLRSLAAVFGSILVAVLSSFASPVQLLSTRNASIVVPVGGNGDSVAPRLSNDGRFVVFSSSASDLVTNANGQFYLNVFLYDRSKQTTVLISPSGTGNGGGNGDSIAGQISANGRYVGFQSDASDLVPGDTNGVTDIFLRDTYTGVTRLISVAADGGFANGPSTQPVMAPDGTCVAFISAASNLAAGDTNGIPDVFVRDLITQTTWLISAGATGANVTMDTPLITPDGRYVAFFSTAQNLAPGVPLNSPGEIYVRDRVMGTTIWASTNAAVIISSLQSSPYGPSYYQSYRPALSDDGRYIAFKTGWTNGVLTGSATPPVIYFQYDAVNGTTTILSTNGFQPWLNCDDVYGPQMTPDGRFVAYVQYEQAGGTNYSSIRLWDRQTGSNVLVSAGPDGSWPSNSTSHTPASSDDGRYLTFLSDATNLVGNSVSNGLHIYRRDLQTATTVLVDVNTNGVGSQDQLGAIPLLSADGSCVAFAALDGGLVSRDNNNASDILLWNSAVGTNVLISAHNPQPVSQTGNLPSSLGQLSLSADGRLAAFASYASDLVPNDSNGDYDVFVRDLATGSNVLVSVGMDGNSGMGGPSYNPILSADGQYVLFASAATNLVAGVVNLNRASDIFRRDLQTGTTLLVSTNLNGAMFGHFDCFSPVSSQDGRYVAFVCRTNFGLQTNLFWRDLNSGATLTVSTNAHPGLPISMGADGQRLSYFDYQSQLYVWDANLQANIYTNSTPSMMAAALSPHGNRLLYQTTNQLFAYDLVGASNLFVYPTAVPIEGSSEWSGDGRYVAFVTASSLAGGDNNGTNDVYLVDLQTGTLTLASSNQSGTGSAAGPSDSPVVSADGHFVVFRTFATDAAVGIMRSPSLIVFDRVSGTNGLLATGTAGTGWTTWVSQPAFSLNGSSLAFQSWDSGLVNGDLNRAGDVFAGDLSSWPVLDSDSDGVPDWWMIEYFGHATGQAGDLSLAQDDADGDGMSNLQEFLAGTDPANPNSLLALSVAREVTGTNLFVGWNAVPGKNYQVLSATNLSNPVWQMFPVSIGMNDNQRYFNVQATNSQRYFRILCGN